MRKLVFILFAFLPWVSGGANEVYPVDSVVVDSMAVDSIIPIEEEKIVLITDEMANAVVHQDSILMRLMQDKRVGRVRGEQIIEGFRVQIYASNRQQQAKNEALQLQQQMEPLLNMPIYALSEPPFWKVRVGNFKTREEANAYKDIFLNAFPHMSGSTYVVPDKIILVQ
ncbi:MAG: SPOR domain-containing protein [Paludibacteraceae bacterium]|nr:SPOR domain-containing protein [Paludibacteraceae bacterium]MBO5404600.1 SPOR domain-containing protein [Paludibacteraceae bacterium]MBR1996293.1 SPOR domain-containing protein [Paludibacteraceae bacterium]